MIISRIGYVKLGIRVVIADSTITNSITAEFDAFADFSVKDLDSEYSHQIFKEILRVIF